MEEVLLLLTAGRQTEMPVVREDGRAETLKIYPIYSGEADLPAGSSGSPAP